MLTAKADDTNSLPITIQSPSTHVKSYIIPEFVSISNKLYLSSLIMYSFDINDLQVKALKVNAAFQSAH